MLLSEFVKELADAVQTHELKFQLCTSLVLVAPDNTKKLVKNSIRSVQGVHPTYPRRLLHPVEVLYVVRHTGQGQTGIFECGAKLGLSSENISKLWRAADKSAPSLYYPNGYSVALRRDLLASCRLDDGVLLDV